MSKEWKNIEADNNKVTLVAEVVATPVFSHEIYGEGFYLCHMQALRTSGIPDVLPVMISDRMCCIKDIRIGNMYEIKGQLRTYNKHEGARNALMISVFAREISFINEENEKIHGTNSIILDGFICKPPIYRKTPLGREIGDLLIAVNRPYGKSDYIPCIVWGRNARFASAFEVGCRIKILGRVQSREYMKKTGENNDEIEKRIAYEVSVSQIQLNE